MSVTTETLTTENSPDFFDQVRVPISADLRALLLERSAVPNSVEERQIHFSTLLTTVIQQLADIGVAVLTGLPTDIESAGQATLAISALFGSVLPQNREGTVLREVRDRGTQIGAGERTRYSDSRFGGSLHTDGAEAPLPAPDLFTLFCVRQSREGGGLQLVHVRDILNALASRPDLLETLKAPFHFDRRGDQVEGEAPTVHKPVLFQQNGSDAITYLRSYIERGHEHDGVPPISALQYQALNALDAVVEMLRHRSEGKMREGELAIFDNLAVLHGRTEFRDTADHKRLLFRTWIRR